MIHDFNRSLDFTKLEHSHIPVCACNGKHGVVMGEVNSVYLSGKIVDCAEWLVVIAFIEELDFIRVTASSYDQVLMLFRELAWIEEARIVRYFDPIPIQCLIQLAFPGLPLLELITLPPRCSQQIHPTVCNAVSTDVWSENALEWLAISQIPSYQCLIPSTRVHQMLISGILIEFTTIDSIGMAVVRCIAFLQLDCLLPLNLIPHSNDRLTTNSEQFSPIIWVIQAVQLLISARPVIF